VEYPGRAVRALLGDPEVSRFAGRTITVADLAAQYGFTDVSGDAEEGGGAADGGTAVDPHTAHRTG
jgi:hypothetical protein